MHTRTAAAVRGAAEERGSPSRDTDQTRVSSGWAGWSWLALGMPITAMPRYRTTRPRNCDPTATQSSPATACPLRCSGSWLSATTAPRHGDRQTHHERPGDDPEPPAPHIRLSFAAIAGPAEITEGVRRLRAACDEVLE